MHSRRAPNISTRCSTPSSAASCRQRTSSRRGGPCSLKHADAKIQARAEKLFSGDTASPRKEIVAQFLPALELPGDAERGRAVLNRDCAACHRFGDVGHDVGPNLAQIRHRSPAEMLTAILDPNREVGPNFMQYAAALDDGRVVIGLVASETPTSITLRRAENQQETFCAATSNSSPAPACR